MKTKAIDSGDFFQVLKVANPMIANNSSKNWPNIFPISFKLVRIEMSGIIFSIISQIENRVFVQKQQQQKQSVHNKKKKQSKLIMF
jgi:hypothetical protein